MSKKVAAQRNNNQWHAQPEWYTPVWLMDRMHAFLGPSMYDPCPPSGGIVRVNGLATSWAGLPVYCNLPYGRAIGPWIIKASTEMVKEIVLLVPAYTDSRWFTPLFSYDLCFIHGRIKFEILGRCDSDAPHPSVLVYRGRRHKAFAEAFGDLGPILRSYRPRSLPPSLWEKETPA